jgi:hypothetical protein
MATVLVERLYDSLNLCILLPHCPTRQKTQNGFVGIGTAEEAGLLIVRIAWLGKNEVNLFTSDSIY